MTSWHVLRNGKDGFELLLIKAFFVKITCHYNLAFFLPTQLYFFFSMAILLWWTWTSLTKEMKWYCFFYSKLTWPVDEERVFDKLKRLEFFEVLFRVYLAGVFLCSHRELSHPPPLLSPQNAPQIALGPHLRPPFLGMPSALCQAPGEDHPFFFLLHLLIELISV